MASLHKLEMAISHEEFFRIFNNSFPEEIVSRDEECIVLDLGGKAVRIRLLPERRKTIASLEWVVSEIELDMTGVAPAAAAQFLARFERAYYKGGG